MISYCSHLHAVPDKTAPALAINGLDVFYPGENKAALSQFNLTVPVGASLALVGSNGAGKSTLFKAISGLLPVRRGSVKVFGHTLGACHHRVVYLPQRSDIDWQFPIAVLDLVMTGRYVYLGWFSKVGKDERAMAMEALTQLGIADLYNRQISQLSGGQQQRVLIARALVQQADLLLLDEPLNAVDAATRGVVDQVLADLKRQGKTVIVATHFYDQEEGRYDGAIFLKDGQQVNDAHHGGDCSC